MEQVGPVLAALIGFGTLAFSLVQWFRNRGDRPSAELRPIAADKAGQRLLNQLKAPAGVDALLAFIDDQGPQWDTRDFYVCELSAFANLERLNAINESAPTPTSLLVRGRYFIEAAWRARGRGRADTVTDAQWEKFYGLLRQAKADLLASAEASPEDPTPHGQLLVVARGLDDDDDDDAAQVAFERAVELDPDNYRAHIEMLTYLSPRWKGGPEEVAAFVEQATRDAPDGDERHMLKVAQHVDAWSYLLRIERKPKAAATLLKNDAVIDDIVTAYERSLGHPAHERRKNSVHWHNLAAFAFFMCQRPEFTAVELERIGKAFTLYPWIYAAEDEGAQDVIERAKLVTRASVG